MAAGCLALLVTGACSGGYPPPEDITINPDSLSRAQHLQAMNELGGNAHPEQRWRYSLSGDDVIGVQARGSGGERHSFDAPLCGAHVDLRHDPLEGVYGLRLAPANVSTPGGHLMLQSVTHFDAALMRGLLLSLQAGCQDKSLKSPAQG